MKILKLFILVLAVTVSITSCSKDDETTSVSGNKYETTYAKIIVKIGGAEQTIEYKSIEKLKENELYLKAEFRSDKTFWVYELVGEGDDSYEWIQAGTWSQKDSNITIEVEGETLTGKIDGSKLIMIVDFDDVTAKKLGLGEVQPSGSIEWHFTKI